MFLNGCVLLPEIEVGIEGYTSLIMDLSNSAEMKPKEGFPSFATRSSTLSVSVNLKYWPPLFFAQIRSELWLALSELEKA